MKKIILLIMLIPLLAYGQFKNAGKTEVRIDTTSQSKLGYLRTAKEDSGLYHYIGLRWDKVAKTFDGTLTGVDSVAGDISFGGAVTFWHILNLRHAISEKLILFDADGDTVMAFDPNATYPSQYMTDGTGADTVKQGHDGTDYLFTGDAGTGSFKFNKKVDVTGDIETSTKLVVNDSARVEETLLVKGITTLNNSTNISSGSGIGLTISANNGNAAQTFMTLRNTDEQATAETGQTADILFEMKGTSDGGSTFTNQEAGKLSTYKISDYFHASDETDNDAGMKISTVTDGSYVLAATFSGDDLAVPGIVKAGSYFVTGTLIMQASNGQIYNNSTSNAGLVIAPSSFSTMQTGTTAGEHWYLDIRDVVGIDNEIRIGDTGTAGEYVDIDSLGVLHKKNAVAGNQRFQTEAYIATTDATPTTIYTVATVTDRAYRIIGNFIGAQDDGSNSMGATWTFTIKNVAGTVTEQGDVAIQETDDSAGVTVSGTVSGTDYLIQVTGIAAENWNWEISIDATVVAH